MHARCERWHDLHELGHRPHQRLVPVELGDLGAGPLSAQPLLRVVDHPRSSRSSVIADGCYLGGGAIMLSSAFLHWVSRGEGSGLRGHALVDAVVALGRHVPALSSGRLTVLWYLVPALAAVSWIACGLGGARSPASRAIAAAALGVSVLSAAVFVRLVGIARLGWGPKVAVVGAAVLCLSAWLPGEREGC